MSDGDYSGGPLDVTTLQAIAQRAATHPLVDGWAFQPDALSPRRLELRLDDEQYPPPVEEVRLDVRWFDGGDYTVHYLESRGDADWQCRWDRHPKPENPRAHYHPPPDATSAVEPSRIRATHHLGVLFDVMDWIAERIERLHEA